jgi:hypothetical protein
MRLAHRSTSGPLPTASYSMVDDAGDVIGFAQLRHRPSHSEPGVNSRHRDPDHPRITVAHSSSVAIQHWQSGPPRRT